MPDDPDSATATRGYDGLAAAMNELAQWESPWADSHYQEHYVWPTAKAMLPDVSNLDVLDAGCGLSHCTDRLVNRLYGPILMEGAWRLVGQQHSKALGALAVARRHILASLG